MQWTDVKFEVALSNSFRHFLRLSGLKHKQLLILAEDLPVAISSSLEAIAFTSLLRFAHQFAFEQLCV